MEQYALDISQDAVSLTRQICDIESVSDNETALADAIEAVVRDTEHLKVVRHGDTVVASTNLGRDKRVVIAGHIDTVPLNNNLPTRFEQRGDHEILWGRGTVDMKAGVAVQLKLAVEVQNPALDVTWIWYDHEEVSSELNGLRKLAEAHPELMQGDFAILGEPSNGAIEGGCNGTLRVDVITRGVRAHSARSWVGHNAIHDAADVLATLQNYRAADVNVEGLVFREGMNAVGITGGIAGNVIPDECRITVNYRFAPSKTVEQAIAHVKDLFAGLEVVVTDEAGGASPGLDAPIAREFITATGLKPKAKYGWTDVARFWALGIPAVNYGPGDPLLAHHDDEHVPVEQIRDCEQRLRSWLTAS